MPENRQPFQIITMNLDFLRIAHREPGFHILCRNADVILPDGAGITGLIRILYHMKVERITGHDLFGYLLDISESCRFSLAVVGSCENVLNKLSEILKAEYPNIETVYINAPPKNFEKDEKLNNEIVRGLINARPDVLLLALGCPRQETWIAEHKQEIGFKIGAGVGCVFDVFTGHRKRAPLFFRNHGLEWLWRLSREPLRLYRRYLLLDAPFFISQLFKMRRYNAEG